MNDKIHKALGIFLDAMRPFVVSFLQQHFPNEPWEGLFFARLKPARQTTWNQAMRAQGENQSCMYFICLLYRSPSPRDRTRSRMPSSA